MRGRICNYAAAALLVVFLNAPLCAVAEEASEVIARFPSTFQWGLANAPAQSEDKLDDAWMEFARQGNVAAFDNVPNPTEKVQFWTKPELEINDAADSGAKVFRMGVDWTRLCPHATTPQHRGVQDHSALARYIDIIKMIKSKGMKVMVTLFHHSLPKWAAAKGGWTNSELKDDFVAFSKDVVDALKDHVDYWVTFNEPTVFTMFTYCNGMWPPGNKKSTIESLECIIPVIGDYAKVSEAMSETHHTMYTYIHSVSDKPKVGIAHNAGVYDALTILDGVTAKMIEASVLFPFVDMLKDALDFCGINYYGREIVKGDSVAIDDKHEYSESGRSVYPDGLKDILVKFHNRYQKEQNLKFSYIVTENGISDKTDILRPAYIIEHLLALRSAMNEGVNVEAFIHWGISDNLEWADGYCPGFGLVSIDREKMTRQRRPSFNLFRDIVTSGTITQAQRDAAWKLVSDAADQGKTRPFCRSADGKTSLNVPSTRKIVKLDWRFKDKSAVAEVV